MYHQALRLYDPVGARPQKYPVMKPGSLQDPTNQYRMEAPGYPLRYFHLVENA